MRRTFSGHTICSSRLSNSSVTYVQDDHDAGCFSIQVGRRAAARSWYPRPVARMAKTRKVNLPMSGRTWNSATSARKRTLTKVRPFWLFLRTTRRHATWSRALWQELCELTGLDDTACRFLSAQPWPPRRVVLHFCDQKSAECSIGSVYCRHPRGDRLRRSASGPLQSKAPQDLSDLRMIQQILI